MPSPNDSKLHEQLMRKQDYTSHGCQLASRAFQPPNNTWLTNAAYTMLLPFRIMKWIVLDFFLNTRLMSFLISDFVLPSTNLIAGIIIGLPVTGYRTIVDPRYHPVHKPFLLIVTPVIVTLSSITDFISTFNKEMNHAGGYLEKNALNQSRHPGDLPKALYHLVFTTPFNIALALIKFVPIIGADLYSNTSKVKFDQNPIKTRLTLFGISVIAPINFTIAVVIRVISNLTQFAASILSPLTLGLVSTSNASQRTFHLECKNTQNSTSAILKKSNLRILRNLGSQGTLERSIQRSPRTKSALQRFFVLFPMLTVGDRQDVNQDFNYAYFQ